MEAVRQNLTSNTMDIETIRALIHAGAKVNAKTKDGETALMFAVSTPHKEISSGIIKLLIDSDADAQAVNKYGRNVLFYLNDVVKPEIVKLLLEKGADARKKDAEGGTPLMHQCSPNIMKMLIDAGADVNARNKEKKTALIVLPEFCQLPKTYQILIQAGADINAKDKEGRNALYYAVHNRQFDVIEYLAKSGIDVNSKDKEGKTVIETLAPSPTTPELVRMLKSLGATGTPQPGWDKMMHYKFFHK